MVCEFMRHIGITVKIIPIRFLIAEQAMHHRAGKRPVRAGANQHRQIRLSHGSVHVDVDSDNFGATFLASPRSMLHYIDLGTRRICTPNHDQIRRLHFARIGAGKLSSAGAKASPGRVDADCREETGIFLGMPQPVDAIALTRPMVPA